MKYIADTIEWLQNLIIIKNKQIKELKKRIEEKDKTIKEYKETNARIGPIKSLSKGELERLKSVRNKIFELDSDYPKWFNKLNINVEKEPRDMIESNKLLEEELKILNKERK